MNSIITVMALGGAGCRILEEFGKLESSKNFQLLAVDSDIESLKATGLPESNIIQAGKLLRSGRGCGGDEIAGQQALANERKNLAQQLSGTQVLIVVAGLGGGLASGGISVVLGVAAKMRITTAVVATLPFSMEGHGRRRLADEKIKNDILPVADSVMALANDLLFSTLEAETPLADALRFSDQEVARSLLAIASVLGGGNLFCADAASFTGVLKRRHSLCAIGTALVDNNENAAHAAMEKMLISPLLGGVETLDTADAVAFSLLGGPELSMGCARSVLELCSRQIDPESEKQLLLGASTDDRLAGKLQLTALTVRYLDKQPEYTESGIKRTRRAGTNILRGGSDVGTQMDLPNLIVENKGIMENTMPVMFEGEDLDIPAYKRRGIVFDKGK